MYILGLNFVYHELSAVLLRDGQIIAAVEEERFSRVKHGKAALIDNPDVLPVQAISYCLTKAGITLSEVDYIGISFDPKERLRNIGLDRWFEPDDWGSKAGEDLFYAKLQSIPQKLNELAGVELSKKIRWIPHHLCHAASAYLVSPYEDAAILSLDGIGEITSTWMGKGIGNQLECVKEIAYPNSLGFLWEKLSKFLGFSEYDAAKVMGLAAFGDWRDYYPQFQRLVILSEDGDYKVDNDILRFRSNNYEKLEKLFGVRRLENSSGRTQDHENIAAALQKITDDAVMHMARYITITTRSKNLCLAGGVALNCTTNRRIMESGLFENIYVQPAANDAGTALGAAYYIWNCILGKEKRFVMDSAYLGPEYSNSEIRKALSGLTYKKVNDIEKQTAKLLAEGNIIGWFQGSMEWGPRALGNRSLLADPRDIRMKHVLNDRIKKRESFRPFAPSVLKEEVGAWFEISEGCESVSAEFMEISFRVKHGRETEIPAVTHIDNTSRIQLVNKKTNPRCHRLISEFAKLTGVPMVLNTSFNDNEPIVCTPSDAVATFTRTKMDYLVIGNYLVSKGNNVNS